MDKRVYERTWKEQKGRGDRLESAVEVEMEQGTGKFLEEILPGYKDYYPESMWNVMPVHVSGTGESMIRSIYKSGDSLHSAATSLDQVLEGRHGGLKSEDYVRLIGVMGRGLLHCAMEEILPICDMDSADAMGRVLVQLGDRAKEGEKEGKKEGKIGIRGSHFSGLWGFAGYSLARAASYGDKGLIDIMRAGADSSRSSTDYFDTVLEFDKAGLQLRREKYDLMVGNDALPGAVARGDRDEALDRAEDVTKGQMNSSAFYWGWESPGLVAAEFGRVGIARALFSMGASPDTLSVGRGRAPKGLGLAGVALYCGKPKFLEYILDTWADPKSLLSQQVGEVSVYEYARLRAEREKLGRKDLPVNQDYIDVFAIAEAKLEGLRQGVSASGGVSSKGLGRSPAGRGNQR